MVQKVVDNLLYRVIQREDYDDVLSFLAEHYLQGNL